MNGEIQRADTRLRRMTIIVLAIAVVLAAAVVYAFHRWLSAHAAAVPTDLLVADLRRWLAFAAFLAGMCLLLLAWHAARLASRARRERRWPLAGRRVLHDTPVRHGDAAARMGRLLHIGAIALVLLCAVAFAFGWRLVRLGG